MRLEDRVEEMKKSVDDIRDAIKRMSPGTAGLTQVVLATDYVNLILRIVELVESETFTDNELDRMWSAVAGRDLSFGQPHSELAEKIHKMRYARRLTQL